MKSKFKPLKVQQVLKLTGKRRTKYFAELLKHLKKEK